MNYLKIISRPLNSTLFLQFVGVVFGVTTLLSACNASVSDEQSVSSDIPQTVPSPVTTTQVTGIISDIKGHPLSEVGIAVTRGTAPFPEILMLTDENGRYVWHLPVGKFTLTASKDGYKTLSQDVEIREGKTVQLNFKLEKVSVK